ncbi:uncharacterized protein C18orf63-like isoform X2 [Physella acuta]|nr:uncharacterized protein C18orf63-like isoform X2 [Physella acuta]
MKQSFFKTGRLQQRLQKQGMQLSKPYRVSPYLYQSCLKYTIIAKLAPVWNKAGDWFLQGREFLVHVGFINAIKMDLVVNKDELFVSLIGTVVKFSPLQVEDLNLSQQEMINILKSTEGDAGEISIADCWCHVLPSMKRGRITTLSLTIPHGSPFSSYNDLKRHWKNMYGYRLPDTDEDILYCQVSFLPSGLGKRFTYPSACLRPGPLQIIQRTDPKPILTAFLQELHSKMSSVCNSMLRFQPKLRYAAPSLHLAGEPSDRINLSARPVKTVSGPVRNINSCSKVNSDCNGEKKTIKERFTDIASNKPNGPELNKEIKLSAAQSQFISTASFNEDTNLSPPCHDKTVSQQSLSADTRHENTSDSLKTEQKFVPLFRPKTKPFSSQSCNRPSSAKDPIVPIFKTKPYHDHTHVPVKDTTIKSNNTVKVNASSSCAPTATTLKPAPSLVQLHDKPTTLTSISKVQQSIRATNVGYSCKNIYNSKAEEGGISLSQASNSSLTDSKSKGKKRKENQEGEISTKKPRVKPQVQSLDVDSLARANQLNKVNTVTLTAWLKERGVICKAKDKKGDLVEKAYKYLNITCSEQ